MAEEQKQNKIDNNLVNDAYDVANAANAHRLYSLLHVYLNTAELINDLKFRSAHPRDEVKEFEGYFQSSSIDLKKFVVKEKLKRI